MFRTPDHATCQHCEARGVFCLEQRRDAPRVLKARSQLDLQERVAKLESLLAGSVLPDDEISIPHGASSRQVHNVNATPITSSENRLERLPSAPLLNSQPSPASLDSSSDSADLIAALFDNGIVSCCYLLLRSYWPRHKLRFTSGSDLRFMVSLITGKMYLNQPPVTSPRRFS